MKNIFLLCILFLFISGCAQVTKVVGTVTGDEKTAKKATEDLTPRQEYYLGRSISAQVLTKKPASKNAKAQKYINTLTRYLALHSKRPETFRGYQGAITKDQATSAMSAPGGFIYISDAMAGLATNEDELAAILAHEIAHIELKHAEKIIQEKNMNQFWADKAKKGFSSLLSSDEDDEDSEFLKTISEKAFNAGATFVEKSLTMKFDKSQEIEADRNALRILSSAGYDPFALYAVISKIKTKGKSARHPTSAKRLTALSATLKKFKKKTISSARTKRFKAAMKNL